MVYELLSGVAIAATAIASVLVVLPILERWAVVPVEAEPPRGAPPARSH